MHRDNLQWLTLAFRAIEAVVESDIRSGFSSCQIALRKGEKLIYQKAWGVQNTAVPLSQQKSVDEQTLYDLASNTKMYSVNYALQYLHSQGALDLDRRIETILGPDFSNLTQDFSYENQTKATIEQNRQWKKSLTLRQVLSHQAGFPADPRYYMQRYDFSKQCLDSNAENPFFIPFFQMKAEETRQAALEAICKTPLMYEPGTRTLYSDVDYMLLGFAVEKLTGKRLDLFLKENFWEPLELHHMAYNPGRHPECWPHGIAATELHGNTRDGVISFEGVRTETLQGQVHDEKAWYLMNGISGHAGLFANAEDLSKLACLMLNGRWKDQVFFTEETRKVFMEPTDPASDHWGLGWWRQGEKKKRSYYFSERSSSRTIGHQGWTGTLTMIDPDAEMVLVVLTNKIHSPVTDPQMDPNTFEGEDYVTSTLGFAARFLYAALQADSEKMAKKQILEVFQELICGRIQNRKDAYPSSVKALRAIEEARDIFTKCM